MHKTDFSKYKDIPAIFFQSFSETIVESISHPPWKVPEKGGIITAPTGAFYSKEHNSNQCYDVDEIIVSNKDVVERTAATIARMPGREPMNGQEYRESLGMKPF